MAWIYSAIHMPLSADLCVVFGLLARYLWNFDCPVAANCLLVILDLRARFSGI